MNRYRAGLLSLAPLVALVAMAGPGAVAESAAVIGTARYDAAGHALVLPFRGTVTPPTAERISAVRWYYDFHPARLAVDLTQKGAGLPIFKRFTVAKQPGGVVRLSFELSAPGAPTVSLAGDHLVVSIAAGAATAGSPTPSALPSPAPVASPVTGSWATPVPLPSRAPAATTIKNVFFDNARHIFVLPFQGAIPPVAVTRPADGVVHVELASSSLDRQASLLQTFTRHPLLASWSATDLPERNAVALNLAVATPFDLFPLPDLGHNQLLLVPLRGTDAPPAPPAAVPATRLGTPVFDPRTGELTLPYAGKTPTVVPRRIDDTTLILDLPGAAPIQSGLAFERVDLSPVLTFWLLTPPTPTEGMRMLLHLPFGGRVTALDDPAERRLVVKVSRPEAVPPPASQAPPQP